MKVSNAMEGRESKGTCGDALLMLKRHRIQAEALSTTITAQAKESGTSTVIRTPGAVRNAAEGRNGMHTRRDAPLMV